MIIGLGEVAGKDGYWDSLCQLSRCVGVLVSGLAALLMDIRATQAGTGNSPGNPFYIGEAMSGLALCQTYARRKLIYGMEVN